MSVEASPSTARRSEATTLLLLMTAVFFWGTSFRATLIGNEHTLPMTFTALRAAPAVVILLVIAIVTRACLPGRALLPWMLLTGDECVVALMGNHLLQGTLTSGYFYGQHYGLSILEASCCALGLLAGGWHTAPIKISMLLLFVPAVWLLMKTVTRLSDWRWGAAAGIAFLTLPAWTIWSLQARGGYLTAFCASMGAMYIAPMDGPQRSIVRAVCMVGMALIHI